MKRVVSVSLGSSARDHQATLEFLGQAITVERIGTDGDIRRATQLFREFDGRVDALGVGGTDLVLRVGDKRYPLYQAMKLIKDVRHTPAVDGAGVRAILERNVMRDVEAQIGDHIPTKRAVITSAVDRYDMALSFAEAGYDVIYGDFMWTLGAPITLRTLRSLEIAAALLLPILGRLPMSLVYPTGAKQQVTVPKWGKYYSWASVIAGDFNYIKRHAPDRLDGKTIVTNTTTSADVEFLRARGVEYLVTTTPRLAGRSFGTNVIEAMLIALAGKGRELSHDELESLLTEMDIRPAITELQKDGG